LVNSSAAENKNVAEITLLRIVDDYYDLLSITSQYPECFQAYKNFLARKRLTSKEGGLTVRSSQQEGLILDGIRDTSK
jgi:hypothetical protein